MQTYIVGPLSWVQFNEVPELLDAVDHRWRHEPHA